MEIRQSGIHNLTPEILRKEVDEMNQIGITFESGLELALASYIIINTLGGDFWAKECTTFGKKQDFFKTKGDARIIHLAHMLWCLRNYSGFQEFSERNKKGDFESAYYEVTAAHFFSEVANSIRFIIPSGVKGSDFDIEVSKFLSYNSLYVEIKARQQPFANESQINDLFNKARRQLPKDGHGVIFCKIKISAQLKQQLTQDDFIRAAKNCLKTSKRISFIVYCWDHWDLIEEGIALAYLAINEYGDMGNIFAGSPNPLRLSFIADII
ncbi:hypothetical protein [Nodularia sp. UHCC 0506]|uniref:hypothetical protein n=1 Tax=Nodularia sp. UHCC 0506 TaxID=3110243 RepID=UPI002B1F3EA6|nr:hypothetical protein [Nodularia sp. UHCC 0506]MEA5512799.1 hypothetical protein [Nodularia sp. UHCC 0506]